ncbi:short-chain dehydrogenase [Salinigranum rubrum]|uniref:Short-chain dehydrogenase n=1 Tax=Salinigranum rubrum TaxID=755307 RepID=A0A2I8VFV2_9EURY|nr:SDR family oxidoreductase [Salinigranum rubrum]AUV80791.1 short-chain dehydrogenase [Salinigranum rubrum]
MDLGLTDKTALVAASSKGLGRAIARRLLDEGAAVTITSRSESNLADARAYLLDETGVDPSRLLARPCDVRSREDIEAAVAETVETFGGLDVLVNNHGGPPAVTFDAATDEQWDDAYELVIKSNVWLSEAALPHLTDSDDGCLVTITSASAREPPENHALSNVFRLGLYGLTKTIAREYAPDVRANVVAPRYVMTERIEYKIERRAEYEEITSEEAMQSRNDEVLLDRPGTPEEFATAVVFLVSPQASYITGDVLRVDGGWTRGAL